MHTYRGLSYWEGMVADYPVNYVTVGIAAHRQGTGDRWSSAWLTVALRLKPQRQNQLSEVLCMK